MKLTLKLCEIREWSEGDVDSLAENANDRDIWLQLRDIFPHPYTTSDAGNWIRIANSMDPITNFAIVVDGHAVGGIGLTLQGDILRKSAEIGYWLGRKHWGKGIATEVVTALTQYGFEQFDLYRIFAVSFAENAASAKVLQKAGYQYEGTLRKAAIKDGRILDEVVYAAIVE